MQNQLCLYEWYGLQRIFMLLTKIQEVGIKCRQGGFFWLGSSIYIYCQYVNKFILLIAHTFDANSKDQWRSCPKSPNERWQNKGKARIFSACLGGAHSGRFICFSRSSVHLNPLRGDRCLCRWDAIWSDIQCGIILDVRSGHFSDGTTNLIAFIHRPAAKRSASSLSVLF